MPTTRLQKSEVLDCIDHMEKRVDSMVLDLDAGDIDLQRLKHQLVRTQEQLAAVTTWVQNINEE